MIMKLRKERWLDRCENNVNIKRNKAINIVQNIMLRQENYFKQMKQKVNIVRIEYENTLTKLQSLHAQQKENCQITNTLQSKYLNHIDKIVDNEFILMKKRKLLFDHQQQLSKKKER
jgi:hypothetical protein